jgi:signal peptidase I
MREWMKRRRARKELKEAVRHARHLRHMREDVMAPEANERLARAEAGARSALRGATPTADMAAARDALNGTLSELIPRRPFPALRENLEVIVVAVAVAMSFRTYFLQPFKIPTGSMQPTLYGITSVDQAEPEWTDRYPFKAVKWFLNGEWYHRMRVRTGGTLSAPMSAGMNYPADVIYTVAGRKFRVPKRARINFAPGEYVPAGSVLWAGKRVAGDHVFVDKVRWNLRRPHRGEVMVFDTRGIHELPPDTHYIKRMAGLPGERVGIDPPALLVDGEPVRTPRVIARIAGREPGYAGYQLAEGGTASCLRTSRDTFDLDATQYFALGDNTRNSRDSRYWGAVPRENLVGPALMIYWPFLRRNRSMHHRALQFGPLP